METKIVTSKTRLVSSALATVAALFVGSAQALPTVYQSAPFQGVTFTFTQTDADTLTFELAGTLGGDWATASLLGAFDLKDLGLDFGTQTGTANGPGAVNLLGLNTQLSASSVDCLAAGSPPGSICFDIQPDFSLTPQPFDLIYTIDFSSALNIASTGPHLQIAFTATQNGPKVGTLYSLSVPQCTDCGGGGGTFLPEPNALALLGLSLGLGGYIATRRRRQ